jgi:hypothetical protein
MAGWSLFAVLTCGLIHTMVQAAQDTEKAKPKHTIKEVMHGAHLPTEEGGKSLRDRVLAGDASPEDKQKLLDFYISLAENEPPRGELEAFQKKTRAVVLAAAKMVVGREGADKELNAATNCAACHKDHKPPQ